MSTAVAEPSAERAVTKLVEMSADLRACAILGADGEVLAESAEASWSECVSELWDAAVETGPEGSPPTQLHVATETGELFATRSEGLTAVALADRFTLASLMFCDLRAALRELAAGGAPNGS